VHAFNSLSRDHGDKSDISHDDSGRVYFQLPLSGSHCLKTHGAPVTAPQDLFQLPLSGSLSPIPGFSGSPRLSAAAPLRTNDF
jgi:hypothetical protein